LQPRLRQLFIQRSQQVHSPLQLLRFHLSRGGEGFDLGIDAGSISEGTLVNGHLFVHLKLGNLRIPRRKVLFLFGHLLLCLQQLPA
jgi:hypothetical protein